MKNLGAVIVSTIVTLGFTALVFILTLKPIPLTENQFQLLNIMFGIMGTSFGTVVNYWLGSSNGSSNKDELLMKQSTALQQQQPATPVTVSTTDAQVKVGEDVK